MSTKDGGDIPKPSAPEHQSLKAPDVDGARNASGDIIKATEATRTNASDGSLRDRAKLIAEQDDSIQIMGMGGRAASRTNRLSESELVGTDPKSKSIDIRELLAKPDKEAQALVNEFGRVTNMPAGAARDTAFSQVQQLADKTYGRGQFAEIKTPPDSSQDKITLKPVDSTQTVIKAGLEYNDVQVPLSQKLADFAKSAQARLLDPKGRQAYVQDMLDEITGVGEGLNIAKEEVKEAMKTAATKAWTALCDGSVANFMATPNAINEPLFRTIGSCLDTMARDPNAVNNVLAVMGRELQSASDKYSKMSPHDRGVQDGKAMFYFVNPEGSTEGGQLAIQAADRAIAPVDKALNETILASVKAAQELGQTSAESALQAKQMLLDYLQSKGISGPKMQMAGVPDGFFEGMQPTHPFKASDYFNAMSDAGEAGSYKPSTGFRGDHDVHDFFDEKGVPKSHINDAGDLVPPDPTGLYKGREVTIFEHCNGNYRTAAKAHSPYTSFGHDGMATKYGKKFEIKVDLDRLRMSVASGELKNVGIVEHEQVLEAIDNFDVHPTVKRKVRNYAVSDKEILIKGVIPSQFIQFRGL